MKKESMKRILRKISLKKKAAVLLAAAMLLPVFAVGCESAQDIIKKLERADEVGKLAESYMQEKYNRGFKVRKCEAAEGAEYKDDFFISFNNGIHAFYDSSEDMFYDDRQSETINEAILRDIWMPMFSSLHVLTDNLDDWSQTFNMVYHYERAGKDNKYSMYNKYYNTSAQYYAVHSKISVTSDNIILIVDNRNDCRNLYNKLRASVDQYFKAQEKGSLNVYAVTSELHGKPDFDAGQIDETVPGCQSHFHFGEKQYMSLNKFIKVTDNLYGGVCHFDSLSFKEGDITLVPVDDFESTRKSIIENMDSKEIGLIDKYTGKKRDIDFEGTIYKAEISSRIVQSYWTDVTLAFMMKESDEPIAEYAEINEKERSFFGYNMNGDQFNATCLCSTNSRSVMFDYKVGDEVYFWFGTQK